MRWIDIEDIAEALEAQHTDADLLALRFTHLREWVLALDGFQDNPAYCNEKILEAIQAAWIALRHEEGDS